MLTQIDTLQQRRDNLRDAIFDVDGDTGEAQANYEAAEESLVASFVDGLSDVEWAADYPKPTTFEELDVFFLNEMSLGIDKLSAYMGDAAVEVDNMGSAEESASFWEEFDFAQALMLGASSLLFLSSGGVSVAGAGSAFYTGASWMELVQQGIANNEDGGLLEYVAAESDYNFQNVVNQYEGSKFATSMVGFSDSKLDFELAAIEHVSGAAEVLGGHIQHTDGHEIRAQADYKGASQGSVDHWERHEEFTDIRTEMQNIANDQNWQSNDANEDPMLDQGRYYFTYGETMGQGGPYVSDAYFGLKVIDPLIVDPSLGSANDPFIDTSEPVGTGADQHFWWEPVR